MSFFHLQNRDIIELSGDDVYKFLQGLITQDIYKLDKQEMIYGLILSPQGRFLYDLFIFKDGEKILLDCQLEECEKIISYLTKFRLHSKVNFNYNPQEWKVFASYNQDLESIKFDVTNSLAFEDPRNKIMGTRYYNKTSLVPELSDYQNYDIYRIQNTITDTKDLIVGKDLPLECNFHRLNAIDWNKGCYIGQEVTARTYHRNIMKRGLFFIDLIPPKNSTREDVKVGDFLFNQEEEKIGEIRTIVSKVGMAMIDLDFAKKYFETQKEMVFINKQSFYIEIFKPSWANISLSSHGKDLQVVFN